MGLVFFSTKISSAETGSKPAFKLSDKDRIYFATNKNPFKGYYSNKGFRPLKNEISELIKPWADQLKTNKVFKGLSYEGKTVKVDVKGVRVPPMEIGANAFITEEYSMFWSSQNIDLTYLPKEPVNLNQVDQKIIHHEVIARGLEWQASKEKSSELNPNPPKILDPSIKENRQISIYTPVKDSSFVVIHCKFYAERIITKQKYLLPSGLLMIYDKQRKKIAERIPIESSPSFFRISGDNHIYLLANQGCYECDGTTILSIGVLNGDRTRNQDIVYVDLNNAVSVWYY